jgi:S1-C subfamily serine protease
MTSLFAAIALMTVTLHTKNLDRPGLGTCTGVFVEYDKVLTAAHCFRGVKEAWAKDANGISYSLAPIHIDPLKDLALVKVTGIAPHPHVAQTWNTVNKGDSVYLVSTADDMPATYSQGIVANKIIDKGQPLLLHTGPILPGSSGSGLFNKEGRLIGINNALYRGFTYAITVKDIRDFLVEARSQ